MDYFTTDPQIEELMEFGFYDDEETLQIVEDFYDDASESSFNELLASGNDFWLCLTFFLIANWLNGLLMGFLFLWLTLFLILRILMMPDTLDFSGNFVTFLGLIGVVSTGIIVVTSFRRFFNSPYNVRVTPQKVAQDLTDQTES